MSYPGIRIKRVFGEYQQRTGHTRPRYIWLRLFVTVEPMHGDDAWRALKRHPFYRRDCQYVQLYNLPATPVELVYINPIPAV